MDKFLDINISDWSLEDLEDTINGVVGRGGLLSRLKAQRRGLKSNTSSKVVKEAHDRMKERAAKFSEEVVEGDTVLYFRRDEAEDTNRDGLVVTVSPSGKSAYVINDDGNKELVKFTRVTSISEKAPPAPEPGEVEEVEEIDDGASLTEMLDELEEMDEMDELEKELELLN